MKGALTKQGGIRKNWLDRWFVLNLATRTLKYYTDKSESQQKGVINVMDIVMAVRDNSVSPSHPLRFWLT